MFLASAVDVEDVENQVGFKIDHAVTIYEVEGGIKYSLLGIMNNNITRRQLARQLRAIAKDLMRTG